MSGSRSERIRVSARSDQCAGSGGCRAAAPHLFGLDPEGWVQVLERMPSVEERDAALEARDACPVGAIDVRDEDGNPLA